MLLRDLVGRADLRLRLLHGDEAALDRPVRWVYTTDLRDPARYLSGGELVISGLIWRNEPADSERFVAAIAEVGVAALAAGAAVFHGIPDDVVEACRRHDVPLLEVPEEVSFGALTEVVVGSVTAARGDRLAVTVGRQRRLLAAVAGGMGLEDLAAQVGMAIGLTCRVLTATGRALAAGPEPLPEKERDAAVRRFLTADRLPAVVPGTPRSVFPVGPASELRPTSWFVAVDGAHPEWDQETTEAVGELVAVAALDRARRGEGLRFARDIADDAISLVADGAGERPELPVRLRQAGLDPAEHLAVAVAAFSGPGRVETARSVLVDAAAHLGPPVVGTYEGMAVALVPGDTAVLDAALARLEPGLAGDRLTIGISRPAAIAALTGALQEAVHARTLAAQRPGALHVVTATEVTSHVALLAAVPDDVRRTFAERVLGPVLAYDARNDSGLMETLEAFLEHSGSWSRTAEHLHLHVNTVRYRIGRVEELTARTLSHFPDRVDVFLALRSR
ncbi:PucR family transcriptional regulator ligand-binding domain-containing protein [Pseudonocardia ailaonensis]|uniref:PucR family transcriptional regulator ligand-binding domain-containing protein n=1 Tax=Pseudonocardia ailaonensis TaxID=367279 RepID=A0ABN2NET9_9PSEU